MKRKAYTSPAITAVVFETEIGYSASVTRSSQNTDEVFFLFRREDAEPGIFRNGQFDNAGDNDNYNFFGE